MTNAETTQTNRSRRPLIIMLLVATLPVVGAYFVYFTGLGMPDKTVNAGIFIKPALSVERLVGEDMWNQFQTDKKWRLIVPVSNDCNEACEANLYTSRQVHIRLAQNSERLERYAMPLVPLHKEQQSALKESHPRLTILPSSASTVKSWISDLPPSLGDDYYLLVDQEGRAMMAYNSSIHGNDVLKDLKRALKYSIDYQ